MENLLQIGLRTINELLTAGIAITAFSMLLYVLSFNLNDRVTRSFAIVLISVTVVFVSESLASVADSEQLLVFLLNLQWVGIIFLPAAYLHLSDALLETTGRPSRGRRRMVVRLAYLLSFLFVIALVFGWLVGPPILEGTPIPHLDRQPLAWFFSILYVIGMIFSGINFWRSYQRTVTQTSRRRMLYLMVGALAPAIGSYPFLLFGSGLVENFPLFFWLLVVVGNTAMSALLVVMAYSVAFFGVSWPDRVIKRRLAKWLMRGPITASTALALTTIVRRIGVSLGADYSALVAFVMVATILIMEHLITLTAPAWERILFRGSERTDIRLLQTLEERTLTAADFQQFLEALLAAICDRLQVQKAFAASFTTEGLDILVSIGGEHDIDLETVPVEQMRGGDLENLDGEVFTWGEYWLLPLFEDEQEPVSTTLLGLIGIRRKPDQELVEEQFEALALLTERATLAFVDRYRELEAFHSLEALSPQIDIIQQLRAASRYDSAEILSSTDSLVTGLEDGRLTRWVKDALSHYWGGPKLTENPMMNFTIVQQEAEKNEDNNTNALRSILRQAIEQTRPEGERKYTADWILFNILEMKFLEGRKVRDIASRLAMSEADLYRKRARCHRDSRQSNL